MPYPLASSTNGRPWPALVGGGIALAIVILAVWPRPIDPLPADRPIRAGTYNIHYGYEVFWHFTLEDIVRTIAESGADIVALQEVDTGRLTSYAVDDAYYLARRLHMNVAYLPTVEHLTGIALLYRGTAESIDSRLLTSLQEQTGIVHVHLNVGGQPLDAYGIWMGLSDEDTLRQINEALDFIGTNTPATFGGDFNAKPDSPVVQEVLQVGFDDPFLALGFDPPPPTSPAIDPQIRIDYVFTRGLTPTSAAVLSSLASDHRMVVVEVENDLP
jgi:endonuclease/exonuclease/phosphatase family metal-dependent hydrolase